MTPKELARLVKFMRREGITHYKDHEIELNLGPIVIEKPKLKSLPLEEVPTEEIKHKIEELTSIMKLDDISLLDRLFPDTQTTNEEMQ